MFPYQDPTGQDPTGQDPTGAHGLQQTPGALEAYRCKLQARYRVAANEPGTRFLPISHLSGPSHRLKTGVTPASATIPWNAFPRLRAGTRDDRLDSRATTNLQEEYVEWQVKFRGDRPDQGIDALVFTTEFPEFFEAIAEVSFEALVQAIKGLIPGANPTPLELLGQDRPLPPLTVDGIVGPSSWRMLSQVSATGDRPVKLQSPGQQPVLRRGARGDAVVQLQEQLRSLNLLRVVDGDFGPVTEAAVKQAQRRYTGGGHLFRQALPQNPWNNGKKGILCLAQQFNTLPFLFELVSQCSVPRPQVRPQEVCATPGVNCVPNRSSDPNVCVAAQNQVLMGRALSLRDPAKIRILELQGIWRLQGERLDINSEANSPGGSGGNASPPIWSLSRGGQRGTLRNVPGLTLDGLPITSGAQVARKLQVGVDVLLVPTAGLR